MMIAHRMLRLGQPARPVAPSRADPNSRHRGRGSAPVTPSSMSAFLGKLDLGTERYPALTGVRAVGASVVFFDHFPPWVDAHVVINVLAFFFALSGFLIVRIYHDQAQMSLRWLMKYFVNRFARIYPVYFLLLSVAICLRQDFDPWLLLTNYTLTHALFHGATPVIEASWSLTVEECFYFLAPVFILLARRYNFLAPFTIACFLLLAALGISRLGFAFLGTPAFVLSTTFFGHFAEFFAGVWLALAVVKLERQRGIKVPGCRRTVAGTAGVSLLVIVLAVVYRHTPLSYGLIILINNFLLPAPIALLYSGLIREDTVVSRLLAGKTAGLLGRSSYSFYLLHALMISYIGIPWLLPAIGYRPLGVLLTFASAWLVAVLLFVHCEEPVNIFIRRRFKSKDSWVGMQATLFQLRP
jgi:peptidoglycan/LPS O-acetylase OafA/YrhL